MLVDEHVHRACALLDKALFDHDRAAREHEGSTAGPLYLDAARWDMVYEARLMLQPLLNAAGGSTS